MSASGERRGRKQRRFVGEDQERFEVRLSRVGELHGQLVDDFLPRRLDPADDPRDGGVEPQHRANTLFDQHPAPVAAADVPQLVREHGALQRRRQRRKRLRQEHDRPEQPEGHRLTDARHVADLGGRADALGEIVVLAAG
jgi:hypothetical protein